MIRLQILLFKSLKVENTSLPLLIGTLADVGWKHHELENIWFNKIYGGFPGDSDRKESACNAGDLGSISGLGRCPWGGYGNPL